MKLSKNNRQIFIQHIQEKLDVYTNNASRELTTNERLKPFGKSEEKVIEAIKDNPEGFKSYFEKVLWKCSQEIIFDLFCIIDGVADPEDPDWKGILLIDMPKDYQEHVEFLHDEL